MWSSGVQHDVLGLEVAVHDAVLMDIVEGVEDTDGDVNGAFGRHLALFEHDLAEQAALDPLHDHIDPGAVLVGVETHDVGVVERQADGLLALEAVEEGRVGLHGEVRDFEGDLAAVAEVGGAEDGRHSAIGHGGVDAVVIKYLAGFKSCGKAHGLAFIGPDALALGTGWHGRAANLFEYIRAPACGQ